MPTLTSLHIWKNTTRLGYFPLESYLSTQELADDSIICVDPTSDDETVPLAKAICNRYPKARIIELEWPKQSDNGSVIGMVSNFALAHALGDYVLNVQADEAWPSKLTESIKNLWPKLAAAMGIEAFEFKVLHTEWNASQFQGGGNWQKQLGAAYTHSIKLWRNCPSYRLSPDAWSVQAQDRNGAWSEDNVKLRFRVPESDVWPILHLHDFYRDTVLERRRVQAQELWPTTPHYNATYEAMRDGKDQWAGLFDDPKWLKMDSPFAYLMPEYIKRHLGRTSYDIHWEDLGE